MLIVSCLQGGIWLVLVNITLVNAKLLLFQPEILRGPVCLSLSILQWEHYKENWSSEIVLAGDQSHQQTLTGVQCE